MGFPGSLSGTLLLFQPASFGSVLFKDEYPNLNFDFIVCLFVHKHAFNPVGSTDEKMIFSSNPHFVQSSVWCFVLSVSPDLFYPVLFFQTTEHQTQNTKHTWLKKAFRPFTRWSRCPKKLNPIQLLQKKRTDISFWTNIILLIRILTSDFGTYKLLIKYIFNLPLHRMQWCRNIWACITPWRFSNERQWWCPD